MFQPGKIKKTLLKSQSVFFQTVFLYLDLLKTLFVLRTTYEKIMFNLMLFWAGDHKVAFCSNLGILRAHIVISMLQGLLCR